MEKNFPSFLRGFLVAIALAASLLRTGPAEAADKVTYAWPGVITVGIAPFSFAQDLGFFKDEGIDFEVITLQGSGVIIPQLLNGTIFSSYASPDLLIISRQPGKPDFDIRYVYNAVRNSIWEISVLAENPIKTVKDLKGKKIGVGALTFANVPMTKAILKQQGIDPASVDFVAVGGGVPAFEALRRGQIDALNLFDVQDAQLEAQGTKLRILQFPPQFRGVSSHGFPVTNAMIRDHPDLIERFGRAATEGTIACEANLTGCLYSYWIAPLDSYSLSLMQRYAPDATARVRIIASTKRTAIPPLVASGSENAPIAEALLNAHMDKDLAPILADLLLLRFAQPDLAHYDVLRRDFAATTDFWRQHPFAHAAHPVFAAFHLGAKEE
jgi:NitT/TauT family transport system substrate-binding protein